MKELGLFCVQYRLEYRTAWVFFYALSVQAAVDRFRVEHDESIVAVFRMEQVGGWQ